MSTNSSNGINANLTRKTCGPIFHTIDFFKNEGFSPEDYKKRNPRIKCGEMQIGDRKIKLTVKELERIRETAEIALETMYKSYKMGNW